MSYLVQVGQSVGLMILKAVQSRKVAAFLGTMYAIQQVEGLTPEFQLYGHLGNVAALMFGVGLEDHGKAASVAKE